MNVNPIIIRPPQTKDLQQIHEIFSVTIKDNFKAEGITDPSDEMANTEIEVLKSTLKKYFDSKGTEERFLIAATQGKVLGTIAYGKPGQLILENYKIDHSNTPEVKSVYVLPDYQNKGIGKCLFQAILKVLEQNAIKNFCLDSGYKRAQLYWKKRLGNPSCIVPDYWGEDHYHLIWHEKVAEVLI